MLDLDKAAIQHQPLFTEAFCLTSNEMASSLFYGNMLLLLSDSIGFLPALSKERELSLRTLLISNLQLLVIKDLFIS